MCTVSYITRDGKKYLTSNRDENINRKSATMPVVEICNGKKIIFPKDPVGGGTWFAVAEDGTTGILLNGAFQKHIPFYPYRKSRGFILLDLMSAPEGLTHFKNTCLEKIEPFTVVFFQHKKLYEFRWDGHQKYFKQLDTDGNYIWSSVTLYDAEAIDKREKLFQYFIAGSTVIDSSSILNFHGNNYNDFENGFIISRRNGIQTQCITQAVIEDESIRFFHQDLLLNSRHEQIVELNHERITEKA